MRTSEQLARRWMTGTRQGSGNRPAWMHPQDLVNLLRELREALPTYFLGHGFDEAMDIAWCHDLIEDGEKEDGNLVSWSDLVEEGLPQTVALQVVNLSHKEHEQKTDYLARLPRVLNEQGAVVKVVDRICNLREGKDTFKPARWARYVRETNDYIVPLLFLISEPARKWLQERLEAARDARPVEKV